MMGCLHSTTQRETDKEQTRPIYSWEREDRPDPANYIISGKQGEVLGRLQGEIGGEQFLIRDCKQCTIFLLDRSAAVTIDDCVNCTIFVGPCKGSVYLRDCKDCLCACICQQFRVRGCRHCECFLHCATQPVIESSFVMAFGCLCCQYPQLKEHIDASGLSVFNNQWSIIHDFTRALEDTNWILLPQNTPPMQVPSGRFREAGLSFTREGSLLPYTIGPRQRVPGERCLVVLFNGDDITAVGTQFVQSLGGKISLVQTKQGSLSQHEAEPLFHNDPKLVSLATQGCCVIMEVCGRGCVDLCREWSVGMEGVTDVLVERTTRAMPGSWGVTEIRGAGGKAKKQRQGRGTGTDQHMVYISKSTEDGARDAEAFVNYMSASLSM